MSIIGVIIENEESHEIMEAAVKVLEALSYKYSLRIAYKDLLIGNASIAEYGIDLTDSTINAAEGCDYMLAGGIGNDYDSPIIKLIHRLNLCFNLSWVYNCSEWSSASVFNKSFVDKDIDIMAVSDVNKAVYYEEQGIYTDNGIVNAYDNFKASEINIEKLAKFAFDLSMQRRASLVGIDRENIMQISKLWRMVVNSVGIDYPLVSAKTALIEDFMLESFQDISSFDVILSDGFLADIVTAQISGIMERCVLPTAYLNNNRKGIYGLNHSFINKESCIALISAISMMMRVSFDNPQAADDVMVALKQVLLSEFEESDSEKLKGASFSAVQLGNLIANNILGK